MANRLTPVANVIAALEDLHKTGFDHSQAGFQRSAHQAATLLRALYKVHTSGAEYTRKDKERVGPLVEPALSAITNWIGLTVDRFPPHRNIAHSKRERSGLQFLLDDYKDFPSVGSKTIADSLKSFRISADIEEWDEKLKDPSFTADFEIVEFDLTEDEKLKLPQSHWWCFK